MVARGIPPLSLADYLALEAVSEVKHEYIAGEIIAMAGAEPEHNLIAQNVRTELSLALRERGCRIVGSDQRLYVEALGEYFYPDVLVTCGEPVYVEPRPRSLVNPEVIVEVLSETTMRKDRSDKWLAYQTIASLTDYVMVASDRREMEHYHREPDGTWTLRKVQESGSCRLANGVVLQLDALYQLV